MLIELPDAREVVGLAGPKDERRLAAQLKAVIAEWNRKTDRVWESTPDYQQYFTPEPGERQLWLKLYPVSQLEISGWESGETEVDSMMLDDIEDYKLDTEHGILSSIRTMGGVPYDARINQTGQVWWPANILVSYSGGYTSVEFKNLYPDAYDAILTQLKFKMTRNSAANVAVTSQSFNQSSSTFIEGSFHPDFLAAVNAYRKVV